ncbi:Dam family site-specific DNA-(adenine-N6)-methyltransferase, partial [Clostridium perfringens]
MYLEPIIKWTGSKRSQVGDIIKHFPRKIDVYFEPFIGGGSVLFGLLNSNIKVNRYICSDINPDLINLWNDIKNKPKELLISYELMWKELNKDDDVNRRKSYYEKIRNLFNSTRETKYFLFLNRTCINGLIRYNSKGMFNSSFHFSRPGIHPERLSRIFDSWTNLLNKNNVEFICCSYDEINIKDNWFVYFDPPYFATKGMYFGGINLNDFWSFLRKIKCSYLLSFDGICGNEN